MLSKNTVFEDYDNDDGVDEYDTVDQGNQQPDCIFLRAWKTYQTEISAGADGRPDFLERKTCNWITETFQVLNIDRNI